MGDPNTLAGIDRHYQADNGFSWFPYGHGALPPQFPIGLIYGKPLELMVGDDLQNAARLGVLEDLRLRVRGRNVDQGEGIQIAVNDVPTPQADIQRVAPDWSEASVKAPLR